MMGLRKSLILLARVASLALFVTQETALAYSNRVITGHTSTVTNGWLLTSERLSMTDDDGATWRDVFVASEGTRLLAAQFLTHRLGWIVLADASGTMIARTHDSGSTWDYALPFQIPDAELSADASMSWVNPQLGFVLIRLPSSSNGSRGLLFRSTDLGRTWNALPVPPVAGSILFTSHRIGWLAGGPAGSDFYVTRDGGLSWSQVEVSIPGWQPGERPVYSPPEFRTPLEGLLGIEIQSADHASVLAVYRTDDGGLSWSLVRREPYDEPGNHPIDLYGDNVVTRGRENRISVMRGGQDSANMQTLTTRGLPADFVISSLTFSDTDHGWVTMEHSQCLADKVKCWKETRVYGTTDGGSTFEDITPASLVDANRLAEEEAEMTEAPEIYSPTGAAALLGSGTRIEQNSDGFDIACSPGPSTMSRWWTSGAYRYIGVYIGGVHAYCTNNPVSCPCPSATWFSQTSGQGWGYIPTWVGIQELYGDLSTDTTTAYNQGVDEANAAADRMEVLGFPSGSIVYFDFERPHLISIEPSIKAFVHGWSSRLHGRGLNAGVYGSYLSAAAWQGTGVPIPPDAIWPYNLNNTRSVFDLCGGTYCLPNTLWSNHQRIHQYAQEVSDTHGGIRLIIDKI